MRVVLTLDLSVTCLEDGGQAQASYIANSLVQRVSWKSILNIKYHNKYIKKLTLCGLAAFTFARESRVDPLKHIVRQDLFTTLKKQV